MPDFDPAKGKADEQPGPADAFTSAEPPEKNEPSRDGYGRYLLPELTGIGPDGKFEKALRKTKGRTRSTTFAKSIADTFTLSQWGKRMVAKGLTLRPDLYAAVAATPLENRDKLNQLCEDAITAAGAKSAANLGTALHAFTEQLDAGEQPLVPEPWVADITAYTGIRDLSGIRFEPALIERTIYIEQYDLGGMFDRIGQLTKDITVSFPNGTTVQLYTGDWVVVDLKTGRDLTYGWNEIAIQLGVYANASAMWNETAWEWEALPYLRRDAALVIHLPVGKGEATLYGVNTAAGWDAAELCADVRKWRAVRTLATPIVIGETTPSPLPPPAEVTVTRTPTFADRIRAASSKADLSAIWKEATKAGKWTSELEVLGKEQMSKIATA